LETHRESFVLESNHISVRTKPSEELLERKKKRKNWTSTRECWKGKRKEKIKRVLGNVGKEKEKKNWVTTRECPFVAASRGMLSFTLLRHNQLSMQAGFSMII
jgi:hypothetical protein